MVCHKSSVIYDDIIIVFNIKRKKSLNIVSIVIQNLNQEIILNIHHIISVCFYSF